MLNDDFLKLEFECRDAQPWKFLKESDVFAVQLPSKQIGYVTVDGYDNSFLSSVTLFPGDKGYRNYMRYNGNYIPDNPNLSEEYFCVTDCLVCNFHSKKDTEGFDEIFVSHREAIRYAKVNHIALRGDSAVPVISKCELNYPASELFTDSDIRDLGHALEAVVALMGILKNTSPEKIGFGKEDTCPLLVKDSNIWTVSSVTPDRSQTEEYPEPCLNDLKLAQIKRLPRRGTWECEVLMIPLDLPDQKDETRTTYPYILIAISPHTRSFLPVNPFSMYERDIDEMMDDCMNGFATEGCIPDYIRVRDDRTMAFFRPFCKKLGIPMDYTGAECFLDDAVDEYLSSISAMNESGDNSNGDDSNDYTDCSEDKHAEEEKVVGLAKMIKTKSDNYLISLPFSLRLNLISDLLGTPYAPKSISKRIEDVLGPTIDDITQEQYKTEYRFYVQDTTGKAYDIVFAGTETIGCMDQFFRDDFMIPSDGIDSVLSFSDGTKYLLGENRKDITPAATLLVQSGLTENMTFKYTCSDLELSGKVISIRKKKQPCVFPNHYNIKGFPKGYFTND